MNCPKCGAANAPNAHFCAQCGQDLTSLTACPYCQAPVAPGMVFCPQCGKRLEVTGQPPAETTSPPSPQEKAPSSAGPEQTEPPTLETPTQESPTLESPTLESPPPEGLPREARPQAAVQTEPSSSIGSSSVVQTVDGDHNIQVNLSNINGSQIDLTIKPSEKPKPLPLPVNLRPAPFPDLLDRAPELQEITQALVAGSPVDISAENGQGKTSLLRAVGNSTAIDPNRYPAGVVYCRAGGLAEPDLLQLLFAQFYQLPQDYKPSTAEIQRGLHPIQALVLLDDLALTRDQLTDLRNQAPNCTFVLTSTERLLWGEGRALALGGLPAEDALRLIERELGRPLTPEEQPAARQLCNTLGGNPDRLLKTAARARTGESLATLQQATTQTPLNPILLGGLSTEALRVLSVVALGRRAAMPLEHIAPLASLPDDRSSQQILQDLQQRRLVQAHSPRYSLTGALDDELWRDWDLTSWADRALGYFVQYAAAQQATPRRMFDSLEVMVNLLAWAVEKQRWAQVLQLGRSIQAALALSLRWAAWLQVLQWILQAARALGEKVAEGWALHQIGSQALCQGDHTTAQTYLTQALQLRQAIGDLAGVAVTRHNLDLLLGPLAPPQGPQHPGPGSSTPSALGGILKGLLALIVIAGLGGLVITLAIWQPWKNRSPAPTQRPTAIRFSTLTPRPTQPIPTEIPPVEVEVDLSLEAGCGVAYQPGTQTFLYFSGQDGLVTVQLDGQTLPDFEQRQVIGQVQSSGQVELPQAPGEHVLTADFDLGSQMIRRECPFNVEEVSPPPPEQIPLSSLNIQLTPLNPCDQQQVQAVFTIPAGNRVLNDARLFYRVAGSRTYIQEPGEVIDDFSFEATFTSPSDGGSRDFYVEMNFSDGTSATTQGQPGQVVAGLVENDANYQDDVNIPQFCVAFLVIPETILKGERLANMPAPRSKTLDGMMALCHTDSNCHGVSFNANTQDFGIYLGNPVFVPTPDWVSAIKFLTPIPR